MTFDEQLQQTFDRLTVRLRDEIAHQLEFVAADVRARARRDREVAAGDAATVAARAQTVSAELVASARMVEAVRALDRASSLTEILEVLATCAAREAPRVGLLLVQRGELRGWRFVGFDATFETASAIVLPRESGDVVSEALRTGSAVSTEDVSRRLPAPAFAALPAGRDGLAVPVAMGGEVVAVLYADQGTDEQSGRRATPGWPEAIELMARHAARCLEARTALKALHVLSERPVLLHQEQSEMVRSR